MSSVLIPPQPLFLPSVFGIEHVSIAFIVLSSASVFRSASIMPYSIDPSVWRPLLITVFRLALIFGIAFIILRLVYRLTDRWMAKIQSLDSSSPKRVRAETLGSLFRSSAHYVVWPVAGIMMLSEVGVDVGALIAAAGVVGLAVGFGAQTLVKDVISGVFLLFDDVIHVGDLVNIGGTVGTVEQIGVRLLKIRTFDGELVMIPTGEIRTFGNKSVDWARVIVPVGLSYEQDVDDILPIMERVAQNWVDDHRNVVLEEEPTVQGLLDFGDSSVTARIVIQVQPGEQFAAERELRQRLKRTFDEKNVEIPFPQRSVHVQNETLDPLATGGSSPNSEDPS